MANFLFVILLKLQVLEPVHVVHYFFGRILSSEIHLQEKLNEYIPHSCTQLGHIISALMNSMLKAGLREPRAEIFFHPVSQAQTHRDTD